MRYYHYREIARYVNTVIIPIKIEEGDWVFIYINVIKLVPLTHIFQILGKVNHPNPPQLIIFLSLSSELIKHKVISIKPHF